MERAECRGKGPDLFFLDRGQSPRPGKEICMSCNVKQQCRDYADRTGTEYGMWAGEVRKRTSS